MIVIDRVIQKQILLLVLFFSMIEPVSGIGCNLLVPPKGTMVTPLGSVYCGKRIEMSTHSCLTSYGAAAC